MEYIAGWDNQVHCAVAKLGPAAAAVVQFGTPHELANGRLLHAPHPSPFPLKVARKQAVASPSATSPTYQTPSPKSQELMYICCIFHSLIPFLSSFSDPRFLLAANKMMVHKGGLDHYDM